MPIHLYCIGIMFFSRKIIYFVSLQLTNSIIIQITAIINTIADIPNKILETSGIDFLIADAIIEIIKSAIIAIFLIKLIFDIYLLIKRYKRIV